MIYHFGPSVADSMDLMNIVRLVVDSAYFMSMRFIVDGR